MSHFSKRVHRGKKRNREAATSSVSWRSHTFPAFCEFVIPNTTQRRSSHSLTFVAVGWASKIHLIQLSSNASESKLHHCVHDLQNIAWIQTISLTKRTLEEERPLPKMFSIIEINGNRRSAWARCPLKSERNVNSHTLPYSVLAGRCTSVNFLLRRHAQ